MVNDLLAETRRRIAEADPAQSRRCARGRAGRWPPSPRRWRARSGALKRFLYARMYECAAGHSRCKRRAQQLIAALFAAYRDDPALLPRAMAAA